MITNAGFVFRKTFRAVSGILTCLMFINFQAWCSQSTDTELTARPGGMQVPHQLSHIHQQVSISKNPFSYSGYYTDSESDLDFCKARYYSPDWSIFISRDTHALANRYGYCGADPVMKIDPEGHDLMDWLPYPVGIISAIAAGTGAGHLLRARKIGITELTVSLINDKFSTAPISEMEFSSLVTRDGLMKTREGVVEKWICVLSYSPSLLTGAVIGACIGIAANRIFNGTWGGSQLPYIVLACTAAGGAGGIIPYLRAKGLFSDIKNLELYRNAVDLKPEGTTELTLFPGGITTPWEFEVLIPESHEKLLNLRQLMQQRKSSSAQIQHHADRLYLYLRATGQTKFGGYDYQLSDQSCFDFLGKILDLCDKGDAGY